MNGIAVSVNNGMPSPGELDNGDRIGVLAVGAEEMATIDFVNPEFTNYFQGTVDDLEMYVFRDNSSVRPHLPDRTMAHSTFGRERWIASQIDMIPGGILQPGDVNRDGSVNEADIPSFVAGWRREKLLSGSLNEIYVGDWETLGWGDMNLDGLVDFHDAIVLDDAFVSAVCPGLIFRYSCQSRRRHCWACIGLLAGWLGLRGRNGRQSRVNH